MIEVRGGRADHQEVPAAHGGARELHVGGRDAADDLLDRCVVPQDPAHHAGDVLQATAQVDPGVLGPGQQRARVGHPRGTAADTRVDGQPQALAGLLLREPGIQQPDRNVLTLVLAPPAHVDADETVQHSVGIKRRFSSAQQSHHSPLQLVHLLGREAEEAGEHSSRQGHGVLADEVRLAVAHEGVDELVRDARDGRTQPQLPDLGEAGLEGFAQARVLLAAGEEHVAHRLHVRCQGPTVGQEAFPADAPLAQVAREGEAIAQNTVAGVVAGDEPGRYITVQMHGHDLPVRTQPPVEDGRIIDHLAARQRHTAATAGDGAASL